MTKKINGRLAAGFIALALSLTGLTALALSGDGPEIIPAEASCVEVTDLHSQAWLCTLPAPDPTTTTTEPDPTTTTEPTTTTTEPTTTTTEPEPTTSTTVADQLVIPPTQYQTIPGFRDNDSFRASVSCGTEPGEENVCELNSSGKQGIAVGINYLAHGMPYLYSEAVPGGHNHAWWEDGDREGYKCFYAFMYDQHPNPFGNTFDPPRPGKFIAQAVIVRATDYARINDTYMEEGQFYFDGTPADEGGSEIQDPNQASDCIGEADGLVPGFDYDSYVPHGPDQIRVGLFRADGEIGDVRDFSDIQILEDADGEPMAHFEFVSFEDDLVQIVLVSHATDKAAWAFYYRPMSDGRIAVEVNGVTHQGG